MASVEVEIEVPPFLPPVYQGGQLDADAHHSDGEASIHEEDDEQGQGNEEQDMSLDAPSVSASANDVVAAQGEEQNSKSACPVRLPVEVWERIMFQMDTRYLHNVSQVSRQHYSILNSRFFQARYFCTRYMPCQAIYYASCRPKLFTPELFQCLLSLGAIMSRYFAQSFLQRHLGLGKLRGNPKWAAACSSTVLSAVLGEATKLYGDEIKFNISTSDGTEIRGWAENAARLPILSDAIREIFVKGRFAVFTADDLCFQHPYSSYMPLANAIALHPDVLQLMIDNGYEFQSNEQSRIVSCIFQRNTEDEERLYERLNDILERHSDWTMSASSSTAEDYLQNPYSTLYAPVSMTEEGRALLAANEGIGPIKVAVKVMKRFYDEGKAFLDMDESVSLVVKKILSNCDRRAQKDNAPALRILYKMFPQECESIRLEIATSYICHFEQEFKEASPAQLSRGHNDLFTLLKELDLDEVEYVGLASSEDIAYDKFLITCIQRGIFGTFEDMTEEAKQVWITYFFTRCLDHPMTGHHLEEMEAACREMYPNEKTTARRNKKAQALMLDSLEQALMQFELNLETLKPDRKHAVEQKLRSPLAWLTKGAYTVLSNNSYYPSTLLLPDIHGLFPAGPRPHNGNESVNLLFAETRQIIIDAVDEIDKEGAEFEAEGSDCLCPECEKEAETEEQGWQHIGHIDELTSAADDSGVVIVTELSKESTGTETEIVEQETHSNTKAKAIKSKVTKSKTKRKQSVRIGHFPTSTLRVVRALCSVCSRGPLNCCGYQLPYHRKAEDMASKLLLFLPSSSPALQDVLMAHALINGNEALLDTMMSGTYGGDEVNQGQDVKPLTKATNNTKGRHGQPDKPILPTLAHLRILQAVERKPVQKFTNRIIEGAPFKTGHVYPSLLSRSEDDETGSGEDELGVRRKWYEVNGHKDDPRLTLLFEEKERLEELDKGGKKKGKAGKRGSSGKPRAKANTNDDDDDDEMDEFNPSAAIDQSNQRTSTRSHLRRSTTKKPVQYIDEFPLSSEEEDEEDLKAKKSKPKKSAKKVQVKKKGEKDDSDLDEFKVQEMLGNQKAAASKIQLSEVFGDGSDLSDLSSEVEDAQEAGTDGIEEDNTDEDESSAEDQYGFNRDDVPVITLDLEYVEHKIPLNALKRRWQSLSLWQEHLRLLLWFERRKERIVKEKAAKLREAGRSWERAGKTKFSLALSDMIRRVESVYQSMDEALQPALRARRLAVIKSLRSNKNVKVEVETAKVKATKVTSKTTVSTIRKRKRGTADETDDNGGAPSSSIRKKLKSIKQGANKLKK